MSLKGKTMFVSGGSRGIGLAIALRAAADGANIVIAAKTAEPHPKLPGTIYTAAKEIEDAGGRALPVVCDIRNEEDVIRAVAQAASTFGGIDICINNASAIQLTGTLQTDMKRYDLMNGINTRGTFLVGRTCMPYLKKSTNPHILTLSPPLELRPEWFGPHLAYTIAKYGMSLCTLGWAEEFRKDGIAANSLWPRTMIATAAINLLGGDPLVKKSRTPAIMADAAYLILTQPSREYTGRFCIDEQVLKDAGQHDLSHYAVVSGTADADLNKDLFVD